MTNTLPVIFVFIRSQLIDHSVGATRTLVTRKQTVLREHIPALEKLIGYEFKDESLLVEAVSHPSWRGITDFKGRDYERMEFLGDAVINLSVTRKLYHEFPDYEEGELTKVRAYLISKDFMVERAKELGLGEHIIMPFGEKSSGGRDNPNNLENVVESIMGAVFLDGGFEKASEIILKLWGEIDPQVSLDANPKSTLQELSRDMNLGLPNYEIIEKTGEMHAPTYKVAVKTGENLVSYGQGTNIKIAEKEAAKNLIQILKDDKQENS